MNIISIENQIGSRDRVRAAIDDLLHPNPTESSAPSPNNSSSDQRRGPTFLGKPWSKKGTDEWWPERLEGAQADYDYWQAVYPERIVHIEEVGVENGGYIVK